MGTYSPSSIHLKADSIFWYSCSVSVLRAHVSGNKSHAEEQSQIWCLFYLQIMYTTYGKTCHFPLLQMKRSTVHNKIQVDQFLSWSPILHKKYGSQVFFIITRSAKILVARSPWQLNFLWRCPVFLLLSITLASCHPSDTWNH
jgi:hypothetical protein